MTHNQIAAGAENILDSISDGIFTIDREWRITSFNRAAESITGIGRDEAIHLPCSDVLRSSACNGVCPLRHTMTTGKPDSGHSAKIHRRDGSRVKVNISTAALRDHSGEIIGGIETIRREPVVTKARRERNGEGEALSLREIETLAIIDALKRNEGNKTATARDLMIERSTLYRKIRDYGIPDNN